MIRHIPLALVVIICIILAFSQQPEPDYRYIYVTKDGWRCTLTIHTDECVPVDNVVGGQR